MKKILGLLLNCVALCLCSAIGIGAGMYWMQNQQQNSTSVPVIHQVASSGTEQLKQTPNLLRVPATQTQNVTPIPTGVAPRNYAVQRVASVSPVQTNPLPGDGATVTLYVDEKRIGALNPDQSNKAFPAGTTFYLTDEELKDINFKVKLPQSSTQNIKSLTWTEKGKATINTVTPLPALPAKETSWPISNKSFPVNNILTLKFLLTLEDDSTQSFTFNLYELPTFRSVKVQDENQTTQTITDSAPIALNGPQANILINVNRSGDEPDIYSLKIRKPGSSDFSNPLPAITTASEPDEYSIPITTVGEYVLGLFEKENPKPYKIFKFRLNPGSVHKPKITQLLDTSSTPSILYRINQSIGSPVPVYLLREKKCELTVPAFADVTRHIRLKYRAINETGGTPKSDFSVIPLKTGSKDIYVLPATLSPGIYEIQAEDSWISVLNPTSELDQQQLARVDRIRIVIPNLIDSNLLQPNITAFKNHLYPKSANPTLIQVSSKEIDVFGEYLQIWGVNGFQGTEPEFLLYNHIDSTQGSPITPAPAEDLTITKDNPVVNPDGTWHVTIHFKKANNDTKRVLYVRNVNGEQHAYSANSLTIDSQPSPFIAQAPKLDKFELIVDDVLSDNILDDDIVRDEKSTQLAIKCNDDTINENLQFLVFTEINNQPLAAADYNSTAKFTETLPNGQHRIYLKYAQGDQISEKRSPAFTLNIQTNGLEVTKVEPPNFGTAPGVQQLKVTFSAGNPLDIKNVNNSERIKWFNLIPSKGSGLFLFNNGIQPKTVDFMENENAVVLTFEGLPADIYQLVIVGSLVSDIFGNLLEGTKGQPGTNYTFTLSKPKSVSADAENSVAEMAKVDFVKYREYEKRELPEDGFNPSDKVVTKVARLYYYRDAHRVAQILNSEVKSMNHKGYHNAQLEADQAREMFQTAVLKRKMQEEKAIRAAQKLRKKENEYRNQQQILSGLVQERANSDDETQNKKLEAGINKAQGEITKLRADITTLSSQLQEQDDDLKELNLKEADLSADLFRRELRAEKSDLYTIGNGKPDSYDAVEQVTIKVIGEGLIHLRGPIKGVNIIRTMINQIDAPVGQVRIAMHTIQVNGEDGKRMEVVADRIQKSIDQSRFLTVQSAQMLRKAIVAVASEVAISTCQNEFGMTQEQRDEKYLYAFFGRDFIEALREMDSEFLQSGNKLLSIHSMDTTSLSSALFVLALAKNEIRQQILAQFYASIQTELPNAECQFLYQGGPTKANKHHHKMKLLAPYANFQSFKGFFDHEVIGTDTMTPVQREFVRLAQIFKAKLVTERELKLHVMERAMIEQRMGDYEAELTAAKDKEAEAERALSEVQTSIQKSQIEVVKTISGLQARVSQISQQFEDINTDLSGFQGVFDKIVNEILTTALGGKTKIDISLLSEKRRAALLRQLFPIEETKENNSTKPLDGRIFKVLAEYFPAEYQKYKREWERKMPMLSRNEKGQFQVEQFQKQMSENLQKEYAQKRSIQSNSKGKFNYGNKTFTFYIDSEGKFNLSSESQYKELDKITREYINKSIEVVKKLYWFKQNKNMKKKIELAEKIQLWIDGYDRDSLRDIHRVAYSYYLIQQVTQHTANEARKVFEELQDVTLLLGKAGTSSNEIQTALRKWKDVSSKVFSFLKQGNDLYQDATTLFQNANNAFTKLIEAGLHLKFAENNADNSRQQLDHKKFLDMQIDETEDKFIELVEGTRAHTANIDNYLKLIATALEDDFNTQFYYPAFKEARDASRYWNVTFGSMETSSILTNNRSLGKVAPKATIEFDLPKRQLAIIEGMNIAQAAVKEYGALVNDPTFLAITSMNGGENVQGGFTIPPDSLDKQVLGQPGSQGQKFGSAFENLIPDPAVFKFETGTGFSVRPVIQPDGQAVVFDLNYLYRTDVREPVRADEKHLGRIKEHFIDTDVQLGNYELREISRFVIALKASRTGNGVPLLSDVPGVGVLFRPTPSAESSLQQSQIMSQAVIYPTLFDLMGLRWAPAVADVGPLQLTERQFISKGRDRFLKNRVYDYAGSQVDKFLQIPDTERRGDLYRTQQSIPDVHPNGYMGTGLNLRRSTLQENYDTERMNPSEKFIPGRNSGGAIDRDRAVPVIPPAEQGQLPPVPFGDPSSATPIKDLNLKPASWSPTEPKALPKPKRGRSQSLRMNGISSPRRIPTKAKEVKEIIRAQNQSQPSAPQRSSFYKRSTSRIKSYFKRK